METEKYLPLGSVVRLKNGKKTIMIYGRKQTDAKTRKEYDYVACLYPEGNISSQYTFMFDHSDIDEVIYSGFSNDEDKKFVNSYLNKK